MAKAFLSGNEAFAEGIRLAKPQVISAYPITPQTIVVERLAQMTEDGILNTQFIHVESEHSALSCAIGASAMGARAFTATSSQGLLYMVECMMYASGGRFPIVMMNANRSTALPWNIYGDHRDSISQLDSGWIQIYTENAQESLDMALQSYFIAEHKSVSTPVMVNLDGFVLTHTYEAVEIPTSEQADEFLPPFQTENKMSLENPKNLAFSVGPTDNFEFKLMEHKAMLQAKELIIAADNRFNQIFGRSYGGAVHTYKTEDADYILIAFGSICGLVRDVVDELREKGVKAGLLKLRMLRPFPDDEIANAIKTATSVGVFEKDISFGYEGTVYTNVNSALKKNGITIHSQNFIGGLGGRNVSKENVFDMFDALAQNNTSIQFIGLGVNEDV